MICRMHEHWAQLAEFPGYEVSSLGRVRSWRPINGVAAVPSNPRQIRPMTAGRYLTVSLHKSGKQFTRAVHRLVLEAFRGPRPPGMETRHLNGNGHDARLLNLEWSTHRANNNDKEAHGTWQTGEQHGQAKLSAAGVALMRHLRREHAVSYAELSEWFSVTATAAHMACARKTWQRVS
jgi:hypothetical protein